MKEDTELGKGKVQKRRKRRRKKVGNNAIRKYRNRKGEDE